MPDTDQLMEVLNLEQMEANRFSGSSWPSASPRIFGGQVVAQALRAAYATVAAGLCHSLQGYFIRPGERTNPVLFEVERGREGKTFATRRVIATQNSAQIFNMTCSFHVPEDGFEHSIPMPDAPPPESLSEIAAWRDELPFDIRHVEPFDPSKPSSVGAQQKVWMRTRRDYGEDVALNQALLAYASDYFLLPAALRSHGVNFLTDVHAASLDHILWFHRPTNFSRWHLYVQDSPSASGARGFSRGALYREDGVLVASVAQEGLIRRRY